MDKDKLVSILEAAIAMANITGIATAGLQEEDGTDARSFFNGAAAAYGNVLESVKKGDFDL